jgi:hypothetical protein
MLLDETSIVRSAFGRSGSIKSKMNFDDPSPPSCMMPIVGHSRRNRLDTNFALQRRIGISTGSSIG